MLKQRVLTAALLMPLVLGLLFLAPSSGFAVALLPLIIVGANEWYRLAGFKNRLAGALYVAFLAGCGALLYVSPSLYLPLLSLAGLWWLSLAVVVLAYPRLQPGWLLDGKVMLITGPLLLATPWYAMLLLRSQPEGEWLVLLLLLLVWGADIGAYFAGRRWGQAKLLPAVSPGKTVVGAVGGSLASIIIAAAAALIMEQPASMIAYFLFVGFAVSWISILGDLAVSLFKRRAGVKDSGTLLPGHGGVLDRIDSVTVAAPLFHLLVVGF